jgi:catechol 2,3-dioxygenase-like lactoylglutathione lyase family enzyme
VIGWHTCFERTIDREVLALLLERGARHHVFSAIAAGDLEALQQLVEDHPDALARRMSRFEGGQTALHYVIAPPDGLVGGGFRTGAHYQTLDLLLELGAEIDAEDDKGRTPMTVAMLQGDREAMRRLQAAGARVPPARGADDVQLAVLAATVRRIDPMFRVADVRATIAWYCAIGFTLAGQHELDTPAAWAGLSLGDCFLMVVPGGTSAPREVSFWLRTQRIDELYRVLKQRQLDRAAAVLAGIDPGVPEARFAADLHDAFYGEREFTIVDLNGYQLTFAQTIAR